MVDREDRWDGKMRTEESDRKGKAGQHRGMTEGKTYGRKDIMGESCLGSFHEDDDEKGTPSREDSF